MLDATFTTYMMGLDGEVELGWVVCAWVGGRWMSLTFGYMFFGMSVVRG